MSKILRFFFWLIVSVLLIIDVFVTVYLLNYNKYNVSQFGKNSILIMDEELDKFKSGDLLVVNKNKNEDIKVGDYIFFYDIKSKENIVNYGKVNSTYKVNEKETTYTMSDNFPLSSEYVIGKGETAVVISELGAILSVIASRWGFLFLVIFPIAILFIVQIYLFIVELGKVKEG